MIAKRRKTKEKVDSIERLAVLVKEGFDNVDKRFDVIDRRFEAVDRRFDGIEDQLRDIRSELTDVRRRLEHLEALGAVHSGYAKEIDHALTRIAILERKIAKMEK